MFLSLHSSFLRSMQTMWLEADSLWAGWPETNETDSPILTKWLCSNAAVLVRVMLYSAGEFRLLQFSLGGKEDFSPCPSLSPSSWYWINLDLGQLYRWLCLSGLCRYIGPRKRDGIWCMAVPLILPPSRPELPPQKAF